MVLEAWLTALHRGELEEDAPREPYGGRLVNRTSYTAFDRARSARLRRWPRVCRDCGEEFRDGARLNAARCPRCDRRGS